MSDYRDINGEPCTLIQLIKSDPEWAENRIRTSEKDKARIAELESALRDLIKSCSAAALMSVEHHRATIESVLEGNDE